MNRLKLAIILTAVVGMPVAALADAEHIVAGACVGPHVDHVVPGDYRNGIPDKVVGDTPSLLVGPDGVPFTYRKIPAGTAYTVAEVRGGSVMLHATHYSMPFPVGSAVGWVRAADVHNLAMRNCN